LTPQTSSTLRTAALSLLVAAFSAHAQGTQPAVPVPSVSQLSLTPFTGQTIQENRGSAALWQTLKQLHTWASVMTIVAHPDDEDGGMLAYEARGVGARTSIMTLTRGEGGQNAMSGQTFDALALVRTNELLNADSWYAGSGITQYFGRVADYGFSKTMDEALAQWGHDRVLYDAVRVVRMNRPLVITSTFVGGITDGHGHHQVAGLLAQEVFKYAGDPKYYPDQIAAGLRPWKPLKVYARQPFFSVTSKGMFDYATGKWAPVLFHNYIDDTEMHGVPPVNVKIPEGTYDPVLGESYFQIARTGLGEQRTQHEGPSIPLAGEVNVGYHRYGADLPPASLKDNESTFFDGIDTSLPGLATLAHSDAPFLKPALQRINEKVSGALLNYIPAHPEKIAPDLHEGYTLTHQLIEQIKTSSLSDDDKYNLTAELNRKLEQFNQAMAEALGLEVSAYVLPPQPTDANAKGKPAPLGLNVESAQRVVVPGSEINVRLHISSPLGASVGKTDLVTPTGEHWHVTRISAPGLDGPATTEKAANINGDVIFHVAVPRDAAPTAPYYSRPSIEQAFYNINDPQWLNHPFAPYPLSGEATFDYDGVPIHLSSTVQTSHMVDGLGSVFEPIMVAPALSLNLDGHAGILPLPTKTQHDQSQFNLPVTLRSNDQGSSDGDVKLDLPPGWTADPAATHFHIAQGETRTVNFTIHPSALGNQTYTIKAIAQSGNQEYSNGYTQAGYAGIRPYNLYSPATYTVTGADVTTTPNLKIGYVMGTGDDIPTALTELGTAPHMLTASDILSGDLSSFDTILIGIRAYASRPELSTANARLLNFVHNGGTLIVQYQGPEYDHNFGPYSYILGDSPERVVDEKDPVSILAPTDPLLNFPNHITSADFDHWVEERGHSFMQSWSPHFTALTETHDPGEDPQQGGLLSAKYGKGSYIYVAYALYRQTPEAVPGAFRLLANLVSAGKAPGR
jgi:LmbE family N-acetylglucosaminyl deacetylase